MKVVAVLIVLMLAFPSWATSESCDALVSRLKRLRSEYHRYATGSATKEVAPDFEEIVAKLDEIVDFQKKMRQSDCKVPPRFKEPDEEGDSESKPVPSKSSRGKGKRPR